MHKVGALIAPLLPAFVQRVLTPDSALNMR